MKINDFKEYPIFLISILLLASILFIFLNPTFSSFFNPNHSQKILDSYINQIREENKIDAREFWKIRDTYSPGSYNYVKNGLPKEIVAQSLDRMSLSLKKTDDVVPFLLFTANKFESLDMLTTTDDIAQLIKFPTNNRQDTVLQTKNILIYYRDYKTLQIIFIKPEKEMETANGFFDYKGYDKEYVRGKYWLSISSISL